MNDLKNTLTRKIGPLPAWAWFGIFVVAIYLYRKHTASAAATSGTSDTSSTGVPDAGTVLSPGESIVNPDGSLTTAPGSASNGSSTAGATDPTSEIVAALTPLLQAIQASEPVPSDQSAAPAVGPDVTPALTATSTKRKAKTKAPQKNAKVANTAKIVSGVGKAVARGASSIRTKTGGRTTGKKKATTPKMPTGKRTVKPTSSTGTRLRSKPKVPAVSKASPTQHPVATHPKAKPPPPPPKPAPPKPKPQPARQIAKPAPKQVKKRT